MSEISHDERCASLAKIPLFGQLDVNELAQLVRHSRAVRLAKGQELFHKGDPGSELFVILAGRLKAVTTSENASDVLFSLMDAGEVCGELALLSGAERSASVVAVEPCDLLALERRGFLQVLRHQPEVGVKLLAALAGRLQRVSELVEDTVFLNLPAQLAKKLVALDEAYGEACETGSRIGMRLSQLDLGNMIGTSRESVNKQMRAWTEDGILPMDRGIVTIRRREVLETLAGLVWA